VPARAGVGAAQVACERVVVGFAEAREGALQGAWDGRDEETTFGNRYEKRAHSESTMGSRNSVTSRNSYSASVVTRAVCTRTEAEQMQFILRGAACLTQRWLSPPAARVRHHSLRQRRLDTRGSSSVTGCSEHLTAAIPLF
jgi:hypothetical protein